MFDAVPNLIYSIVHYMAHRMFARVHFDAIQNFKQKLKDNSSKHLIVIYSKQIILQMKYRGRHVEYYGKWV